MCSDGSTLVRYPYTVFLNLVRLLNLAAQRFHFAATSIPASRLFYGNSPLTSDRITLRGGCPNKRQPYLSPKSPNLVDKDDGADECPQSELGPECELVHAKPSTARISQIRVWSL